MEEKNFDKNTINKKVMKEFVIWTRIPLETQPAFQLVHQMLKKIFFVVVVKKKW